MKNKNLLLWIGLAAVGVYLLTRKKAAKPTVLSQSGDVKPEDKKILSDMVKPETTTYEQKEYRLRKPTNI